MSEGRRRVLHLVNGDFYAGAERVQDLLAACLPALGYDVEFACLKEGEFAVRRQTRSTVLHRLPMRSRLDFGPVRDLVQLTRAGGHCLIHTHTIRSALIGQRLARRTGLPLLHHVHSPSVADTEALLRNLRNSLIERFLCRRADALVCVSASLEAHLRRQGARPAAIRTVWNGVPVRKAIRRTRRGDEPLTLGMVALFRPRKGAEVLLEAMARLRDAGCRVCLHAIGGFETESYRQQIQCQVARLGLVEQVRWRGFRDDVTAELAQVDALIVPSLFGEGTPMVVLEAMAAGIPVVASRVEGIPAVIRAPTEGWLVEPGSADDLARTIHRIAADPGEAARIGERGQRRQRARFSDAAMAAGVAAVYADLLQTAPMAARRSGIAATD